MKALTLVMALDKKLEKAFKKRHRAPIFPKVIVGSLVTAVAGAVFLVAYRPFNQKQKWTEIQTQSREEMGVAMEDRQPGGMKQWTVPFEQK